MTLTEFVLARIAEDDAVARAAHEDPDPEDGYTGWVVHEKMAGDAGLDDAAAAHIVRFSPAHILTECKAKRRIVSLFTPTLADALTAEAGEWDETAFRGDQALRALALPYADHPEFREEWRP